MREAITIVVPIHAKPEMRAVVRARLLDLAAQTHRESGNLCYVVHEVPSDPDQFLIYEKWANQAALDFHMAQGYLRAFLADQPTLLAKEIAGTICHEMAPRNPVQAV